VYTHASSLLYRDRRRARATPSIYVYPNWPSELSMSRPDHFSNGNHLAAAGDRTGIATFVSGAGVGSGAATRARTAPGCRDRCGPLPVRHRRRRFP
jgi:hypothetical protein